jgi:hypothetical protein
MGTISQSAEARKRHAQARAAYNHAIKTVAPKSIADYQHPEIERARIALLAATKGLHAAPANDPPPSAPAPARRPTRSAARAPRRARRSRSVARAADPPPPRQRGESRIDYVARILLGALARGGAR